MRLGGRLATTSPPPGRWATWLWSPSTRVRYADASSGARRRRRYLPPTGHPWGVRRLHDEAGGGRPAPGGLRRRPVRAGGAAQRRARPVRPLRRSPGTRSSSPWSGGRRATSAEARRLFEEAAAIGRTLDARWPLYEALNGLGVLALQRDEVSQARRLFEEAAAAARGGGARDRGSLDRRCPSPTWPWRTTSRRRRRTWAGRPSP